VVLSRILPLTRDFFPASASFVLVVGALMVFAALIAGLLLLRGDNRLLLALVAVGLLAIFIFIKAPWLSERLLAFVGDLRGRTLDDSVTLNIAWLGYSYVAFRLLHTIRDRQSGVLPAVGLAEYVNYVIFFPSFTAGPIDRLERFIKDLRAPLPLKNDDWLFAGQRLAMGLFKKFFVADLLALVSITDVLVGQTRTGGWLWFELCAYSLRLYFDFSGYTDIAIGMARLMGVRLPENFAAPFFKSNLTQFWNSWHMTLTQWFRVYFFNPFTRSLRTSKRTLPPGLIILLTQVSTMLLIGLWHGITLNFALWGLWHGLGLFVQNRWSEFARLRFPNWGGTPFSRSFLYLGGVFMTFTYFTLGLVFFAALLKLFGMS
jgi:alginate O-acetyltransferase complex protein AlgI